jgi:hypothetical protein
MKVIQVKDGDKVKFLMVTLDVGGAVHVRQDENGRGVYYIADEVCARLKKKGIEYTNFIPKNKDLQQARLQIAFATRGF